jgi:NAD-dependent dihydropyrimidine dehydrogenase PreA subunit
MKRILSLVLFLQMATGPGVLYAQDEFKEWGEDTVAPVQSGVSSPEAAPGSSPSFSAVPEGQQAHRHENLYWLAAVALATVVAGVLVRYKRGRAARPFFLVASVAVLGFYRGSCPCPVGGFQEGVLFLMGYGGRAGWLWWFVILLPLTYLFGKVWCGWVCHLGALQELLYRPGRFHFLTTAKAQRVMRYLRIGVLIALVVQLALTHHLWWKEVDPFKTAFNLMATDPLNWLLVGVLLVSSVLMYRPFCKALCPVGLVLGWVNMLPRAAGIGTKAGCIGCKACSSACSSHAITWNNKTVVLDGQECIACGECLDVCRLHALQVTAKRETGGTRVLYTGKEKEGPMVNKVRTHNSSLQ